MQIRGEGLATDGGDTGTGTSRQAERVVYILHPNTATD